MEERLTVRIGANIKDFEQKMSRVQGRMDKVGGKMSSIGSTFTKGTAMIVGGAAAAGAGLYGLTSKVTKSADAIAKGSERMGVSTKAYQEMDFWASQNGLSQEDMEKAVGRLNQRLGLAVNGNEKYATALERLGVDLDGVKNGTVSTEDAMAQSIQTLSTMENENEKAALASELFGTKLSRELMPALNDGSLTMDEAKKKAQELGIVMSDDQLKAAEAFQDSQDQIKRSLAMVGMEIGMELMPHFERMHQWILDNLPAIKDTITGAFESVIGAVKSVVDWWQGLSDLMKTIIPIVSGVALAFGPVLLVVGKVITVISGLMGVLSPLMASITKAGGLLKWLAPLFGALTSPITLTIAAIAALGTGFVIAYNKSESFRNFIDGLKDRFMVAWEAVVEFKDNFITAFDAIFALFKGDDAGIDMLKSLGLSDDQISMITGAIDTIKGAFENFREGVQNAVDGIADFFIDQFSGIKSWWDADGQMILAAISTVFEKTFDTIRSVAKFGLDFVKNLFQTFAPIVEGIWSALWPTVVTIAKNAWSTIELVIGTAMDVIKGIISAVSAIIEGDWEAFGTILKDTALSIKDRVVEHFGNLKDNAIELVNNLTGGAIDKFVELKDNLVQRAGEIKDDVVGYFTGLKDDAIAKVTEAYNSITGWFSDMKSTVTDTASGLRDDVTGAFSTLKDNTIGRAKDAFTGVTGWFSDMWSDTKSTAGNLRDDVSSRFSTMKDNTISRAKNMWSGVTGWFSDTLSDTVSDASSIRDDVSNRFDTMKENTVSAAKSMWSGVTDFFSDIWDDATTLFDDMVQGAKDLPGRIGEAISGAASFAVDGVKSLGNKMASSLETVVNGVVDGLNKLLDKIGLDDLLDPISINRFSTGTAKSAGGYTQAFSTGTRNGRIASDMLGILNDKGPGNGRGGAVQELIERNGKLLMPKGRDVLTPLKKGDRIYSGAEVQSMQSAGMLPRFNSGTGTEGGNSGSRKGLLGTLGDVLGNVWDYITNPGKAFKAVIDNVTGSFDNLSGFASKMASGVFGLVKDQGLKWLTGIFKDNGGALGTGRKGSFMNYRMTTPYSPNAPVPGYPTSFNGGKHYGVDYGTPIGTPVHATMSGKLSQFWNEGGGKVAKLVSGNLRQFFMHMQSVAPSGNVKAGDVIGKTGNSGRWTTGPHVHWQAQQGTDALNRNTVNPLKVVGHANGGIFRNRHIAEINEEGPEAIIPLSAKRRGRANSLYDSVGKALGRNDDQNKVIGLLEKQNQLMEKAIDKDLAIYMDREKVGGLLDERDYNNDTIKKIMRGR